MRLKTGETVDDLQRNGLRIIQDKKRFRFGMDAVLLSEFAKAGPGDRVLDIGTGTGIIPILMSARTPAEHFTALEIQSESADMAGRSVTMNGLDDRIRVIRGDIREADRLFAAASFDVITCNPPYMTGGSGLINDAGPLAAARHEILCSFEDIAGAAARLLKSGGHFYLIHRPLRLAEIMTSLVSHRLEPKRIRFVYPFIDHEPNMVLFDCVQGGRSQVRVEKPLIVYNSPGCYTDEILEIYGMKPAEGKQ